MIAILYCVILAILQSAEYNRVSCTPDSFSFVPLFRSVSLLKHRCASCITLCRGLAKPGIIWHWSHTFRLGTTCDSSCKLAVWLILCSLSLLSLFLVICRQFVGRPFTSRPSQRGSLQVWIVCIYMYEWTHTTTDSLLLIKKAGLNTCSKVVDTFFYTAGLWCVLICSQSLAMII